MVKDPDVEPIKIISKLDAKEKWSDACGTCGHSRASHSLTAVPIVSRFSSALATDKCHHMHDKKSAEKFDYTPCPCERYT